MTEASASSARLVRCAGCEMLSRARAVPPGHVARCRRCGTRLHLRKPQSLQRAAALVLTAYVCYVPANLYPVMYVSHLGKTEADTIASGVESMFAAGWWAIALLILFASITVPLLKLVVLTYLICSVRFRFRWGPAQRTVLYRVVEYIGRWSMLDMFVVSLTVALIQLGVLANVRAGPGTTWFAAVVVITMLAAMSFDPRLLWDAIEEESA